MSVSISKNNPINFEQIYIEHYSKMKRFAVTYVLYEEEAENIVQDVFLDLWERRESLLIHLNIVGFLFTSVKNKCIDYIRHEITKQETTHKIHESYCIELQMKFSSLEIFEIDIIEDEELNKRLYQAIDLLPDKCKEIFVKNKIEGKKQKEIAEELNISVNTVEAQMSIAYKKLKLSLKNIINIIIFLLVDF